MVMIDEKSIKAYFDLLQVAFRKCQEFSNGEALTSNRVFAADEVGFSTEKTNLYIITQKGVKRPFMVDAGSMAHVSVMAFAASNGWAGPEFFIVPGVRQKASFNNQVKNYFPDATVTLTSKGFMTQDAFVKWANFFVEEIKSMRGDENHWALLVVDGHNSHAFSLDALKILNSNNILVLGLPSHTTHLLQVHDVAIFRSLKEGSRKSYSEWIKQHGLKIKLSDFPQILSQPWANANSANNIRNGFKATGLWPINVNWIKENKFKIQIQTLSLQEKFDKICAKNLLSSPNGFKGLIDRCAYLNVDFGQKKNNENQENSTIIQNLNLRSAGAQANLRKAFEEKKDNKNQLGESHASAKILNDSDRLQKLEEYKENKEKKTVLKKKVKIIKKAKTTHEFISQITSSENDSSHLTEEDVFDDVRFQSQPSLLQEKPTKTRYKNKEHPVSEEEMKESTSSFPSRKQLKM